MFDTILVPVASTDDARTTALALREHFDPNETGVTFVFVVEKGGGAPDKAGVEQREELAEDAFDAAREAASDFDIDSRVVYGENVADAILAAADDADADAVVFVPRDGSRLARFLSGDVALSLVTEADRPVVSLPDPEGDG